MTSKRPAVGLFHFNIRYIAGDKDSYIRYAREVIEPFLDVLETTPKLRTSVNLCGADIEYLAQKAPETLERLRTLVDAGQLELLSALYSNAIWIAFPQRDLLRSVELNRRVLDQHRLHASGVFFSQEAFWGPGIRHLSKYFSRAVCKDDYLKPASGLAQVEQAYRLVDLCVIVGANHLLNQICSLKANDRNSATLLMYKRKLDAVREYNIPNSDFADAGACWYHLGSAHHLVTAGFPQRRETFFSDGDWIALVKEQLELLGSCYEFSFIRELKYDLDSLPEVPLVTEGSWNYRGSSGVRRWMGWHSAEWERDATVLATAWQTRSALLQCERTNQESSGSQRLSSEELDQLWKKQLLVEGSDSLGWLPRRIEVESSLQDAESLLVEITSLTKIRNWQKPFLQTVRQIASRVGTCGPLPGIESDPPTAIGNAIIDGWSEITPGVYFSRAELRASGQRTGIHFNRTVDTVSYCSSADEQNITTIRNQDRTEPLFLPLANGLLSLGENDFLILVNRYGKVAAEIAPEMGSAAFTIEGPGGKRPYSLVFLRYHGGIDPAIELANEINEI